MGLPSDQILRIVAWVDNRVEVIKSIAKEVQEINKYFPRSVLGLIQLKLLEEGLHQQHY